MASRITDQDVHLATTEGKLLRRSGDIAFATEVVSSTGIFVRLASPPPLMTLVQLRFSLPGHPDGVVLLGSISRVERGAGVEGMGVSIAFFAKSGDAAKAWDRYLKTLGPPIQVASRHVAPGSAQWAQRLRSEPSPAGRRMSTRPSRGMGTLSPRRREGHDAATRGGLHASMPPRR